MDFIIVNTNDGDVTISVDKIVSFRDLSGTTEINLIDQTHVYATGEISKKIREELRNTKYQLVKIGE